MIGRLKFWNMKAARKSAIVLLALLVVLLAVSFFPFGSSNSSSDEKAVAKEKTILFGQIQELDSLPPAVGVKVEPAVIEAARSALASAALAQNKKEAAVRRKISVVVESKDDVSSEIRKLNGRVGKKADSVDKGTEFSLVEVDAAKLADLAGSSDVVRVYPKVTYYAALAESVPLINAGAFWDAGFKGGGVKVAVLDTGVDTSHPMLQGRVVAERDFSSSGSVNDVYGHGTHVAGIIAGSKSGGGLYDGVAPDAQLLNAKVLDDAGSGDNVNVIGGIGWAVDSGAKVISMSLGAPTELDASVSSAIKAAVDKGVVVVVAAGNCGAGCPSFHCKSFRGVESPGSSPYAITVGAVDKSKNAACFSSGGVVPDVGIKPDFAAPGAAIRSSVPGGGYASKDGTSMATPHVSGAVALLLSKNPALSPADVRKILERTSIDLGDVGKDTKFGFGLIDLGRAFIYREGVEFSVELEKQVVSGSSQGIRVTVFDDVRIKSVSAGITKPDGTKSALPLSGSDGKVFIALYSDTALLGNYIVDVTVEYGGSSGSSNNEGSTASGTSSLTVTQTLSFRVMGLTGDFGSIDELNLSREQFLSANLTANITFTNAAAANLIFSSLLQLFRHDAGVLDAQPSQEIRIPGLQVASGFRASAFVNNKLEVGPGNYTLRIITDYTAGSLVNETNITVADDVAPRILGISYSNISKLGPAVFLVTLAERSSMGSVTVKVQTYVPPCPNSPGIYCIALAPTIIDSNYTVIHSSSATGLEKELAITLYGDLSNFNDRLEARFTVCDAFDNCAESGQLQFNATSCSGRKLLVAKAYEAKSSFEDAASQLGSVCLAVLNKAVSGTPPAGYMELFDAVVWTTGTDLANIDGSDAAALAGYYSKKGRVAVEGSDVAFRHGNDELMRTVLHATLGQDMKFTASSSAAPGSLNITQSMPHPSVGWMAGPVPFNLSEDPFPDAVLPYNGSVELAKWNGTDIRGSAVVAYESEDGSLKSLLMPFYINALGEAASSALASSAVRWLVGEGSNDISASNLQHGLLVENEMSSFVASIKSNAALAAAPKISVYAGGALAKEGGLDLSTWADGAYSYPFQLSLPSGKHSLRIVAGSDFLLAERNYVNNVNDFTVTVYPRLPDLLFSGLSYSFDASSGALSVAVNVSNLGGTAAASGIKAYLNGKEAASNSFEIGVDETKQLDFALNSEKGVHSARFVLDPEISVEEYNESNNELLQTFYLCSREKVLVVDDNDGGFFSTAEPSSADEFLGILRNAGYCAGVWDEKAQGAPSAGELNSYKAVVWTAGDYFNGTLGSDDFAAIENYNGGLLLEGSDIGMDNAGNSRFAGISAASFDTDVLLADSSAEALVLKGHQITAGISSLAISREKSPYPDNVEAVDGEAAAEWQSGKAAITARTMPYAELSPYKTAYYSFSVDGVTEAALMEKLVLNTVQWLLDRPNRAPAIANITNVTVNEGESAVIAINATDADNGLLEFGAAIRRKVQNAFSDGSAAKFFAFPGKGSATAYLDVPKKTPFTNISLEVEGVGFAGAIASGDANGAANGGGDKVVRLSDGSLYVMALESGIYRLYKSADGGATWSFAADVADSGLQGKTIGLEGKPAFGMASDGERLWLFYEVANGQRLWALTCTRLSYAEYYRGSGTFGTENSIRDAGNTYMLGCRAPLLGTSFEADSDLRVFYAKPAGDLTVAAIFSQDYSSGTDSWANEQQFSGKVLGSGHASVAVMPVEANCATAAAFKSGAGIYLSRLCSGFHDANVLNFASSSAEDNEGAPDIAYDSSFMAHVVSAGKLAGDSLQRIYYAKASTEGSAIVSQKSIAASDSVAYMHPKIRVDSGTGALQAFFDGSDGNIYYAESFDSGATWSDAQVLQQGTANSGVFTRRRQAFEPAQAGEPALEYYWFRKAGDGLWELASSLATQAYPSDVKVELGAGSAITGFAEPGTLDYAARASFSLAAGDGLFASCAADSPAGMCRLPVVFSSGSRGLVMGDGIMINASPIARFGPSQGSTFTWQTDPDDSGQYEAELFAYDAESVGSGVANVTVLDVSYLPAILGLSGSLEVREGKAAVIRVEARDADTDKSQLAFTANDSRFIRRTPDGVQGQLAAECGGIMGLPCPDVKQLCELPPACEGCSGLCHMTTDSAIAFFEWQTSGGDAGIFPVNVTVSDGALSASATAMVVVSANAAPSLDSLAVESQDASEFVALATKITVKEGQTKNFSILATDPDGDPISYMWLLNGTVVSTTNKFSFSPKYNESGDYNLTIIVSDGQAETRAEFLLVVLDTMDCEPLKGMLSCPLQLGVCKGSAETCSDKGKWPGCNAADYLAYSSKYEISEKSCDGFDNDCDGQADEAFGDVDSDGKADCIDDDNDNDGVKDDEDDLIGNADDVGIIGEGKNVKIEVEEDRNDPQKKSKMVRINNSDKPLVQFLFNFSKGNVSLRNVVIEKESSGSEKGFTMVRGLDLKGRTKQVFVDRIVSGSNAVCVKDFEVLNVGEVTAGCSGEGESVVECGFPSAGPPYGRPGWACASSNNQPPPPPEECEPLFCQYIKETGQYQVYGLRHSAVLEQCIDADLDTYLPVGCSGGSDCNDGDSLINSAAAEVCNGFDDNCNGQIDENWVCNTAPVLQSIGNKSVNEGQQLLFTAYAFDIDGNPLVFNATNLPAGAWYSNTSNIFDWTPDFEQAGIYTVTFKVSDGFAFDYETINITVANVNRAPVFETVGNKTVMEDATLSFTVSAADPDGDSLAQLFANMPERLANAQFSSSTKEFKWAPTFEDSGTYAIGFTASDGQLSANEFVNVTVVNVNRPPRFENLTNQSVYESSALAFFANASDADGDVLQLVAHVPRQLAEAEFDAARSEFSWTPGFEHAGLYAVRFTADDSQDTAIADINLTVVNVNRVPVFTNLANITAKENEQLQFTAAASDPDNDLLTTNATGLPKGAGFDNSTASFAWTPGFEQAGTYYGVIFTVSDGLASGYGEINITIGNTNRAPLIAPIENQTVNENSLLKFRLGVTDPDGDRVMGGSIDAGMADGFQFDEGIFEAVWTPTFDQAGDYTVRFSFNDGVLSANAEVNITVLNVNRPPQLAGIYNLTGKENSAMKLAIGVSDPDGDGVVVKATLPEGAEFGEAGNEFSWTPTFEQAGDYRVLLIAADGFLPAYGEFNITVLNVNRPPQITLILIDPPELVMDEGETKTFTTATEDSDGDELSVEWKVNGVTVSEEPVLEFSTQYDSSGEYAIELLVSDSTSTTSEAFSLTVHDTLECGPAQARLCPKQLGVCASSFETCTGSGQWPGCGSTNYGSSYVVKEEFCSLNSKPNENSCIVWCDEKDNDCDGSVDEEKVCNTAPALQAIGNRTVKENETLEFGIAAFDAESDALAFTASNLPDGALLGSDGSFAWTPAFDQAVTSSFEKATGSYKVMFTVSDSLQSSSEQVNITVVDVNRLPELKIKLEPEGNFANEGEAKLLKADAFDPDGDSLRYAWFSDSRLVSRSSTYRFVPNWTDGDGSKVHKFFIYVTDSDADDPVTWSVVDAVDVVVQDTQACKPESINTSPCGLAVGKCRQGTKSRACGVDYQWGGWGGCVNDVEAVAEDCGTWDDDDCDGEVNEGCRPDLATSWMMFKAYDTSSGEISQWDLFNASITMRILYYGRITNVGKNDTPPTLAVWYLNNRSYLRAFIPRIKPWQEYPVFMYSYIPYSSFNNATLVLDANSSLAELDERNNEIDFPVMVKYNETYRAWAEEYSWAYYSRFPTREECESRKVRCW
ncbi:S8 family serine peptidase [Candidatus Woesearchaeota archaeon]|nr:S8 family serine peptidase [Candidatus Woesearchaeota archaeon]